MNVRTYLCPRTPDVHLGVPEVIERLRRQFQVVVSDNEQGSLAISTRVLADRASSTHEEFEALLVPLADATIIVVSDDPESDIYFLRTLVVPNMPIEIEWVYPDHQRNCAGLLQRYADVLGYTVALDKTPNK